MIIWQITDKKTGHTNQVIGLIQALRKITPVNHYKFSLKKNIWQTFAEIKHKGSKTPSPDFIIGAGHKTHIPLLYTRHKFNGRIILMMKPSLPKKLFDIIIAPEHDNITGKNIIISKGALNKIEPKQPKNFKEGLILIGGKSSHFHWDNLKIIAKVRYICSKYPEINWHLTNSRRTPTIFNKILIDKIQRINNITFTPYEETNEIWLPQKLNTAYITYVTNDSVSMIYESLTAQTNTHLIRLKPKSTKSSLVKSIDELHQENYFSANPPQINEAERIAKIILTK